MTQRRRVLVARLFHESHFFSPFTTGEQAFTIMRGEVGLAELRNSDTTLGGIVREFEKAGAQLTLCLSAVAPPGGLVEHAVYERFRDEICDAARSGGYDGIALEMHGAMGTPSCPDAEGDLLRVLRHTVGADVAIGVGLDLHAHLTPAMLEFSDICIACKKNPHSDAAACGEKNAAGLLAMMDGALKPVRTLAKTRMVLPGAQETTAGPLRELHAEARAHALSDKNVWDISLFNVFRALDDLDMGQAVVITSHEYSSAVGQAALDLATGFWNKRHRFSDALWNIGDALSHAVSRQGTERFVLADMGDRVLAGAPGDSTAILAALISTGGSLRAALHVTDPETVTRACNLGIGTEAAFQLGGKMTPGFAPLPVTARFISLSDGVFSMAGPYQGGEKSSLGKTAVLRVQDRINIIVTTLPGFSHDPQAFEAVGVRVAEHDVIVVKSGYHFVLNFAGLATPMLLHTPGMGYYTKGQFHWQRGRFWPEHDITDPVIGPFIFPNSAQGAA